MGLLEVVARTVIIYFVVLLIVRLMGKREIGQLSPFDFVVAIVIAEVAALPMEQPEIPLLRGLVPLFVLVTKKRPPQAPPFRAGDKAAKTFYVL